MQYAWERSYPESLSWSDPLPAPVPLESYSESAASTCPDKIAIDFYDRLISFAELDLLARRVAKGLQSLGVAPGVNVGLLLSNCPHFVACFFGTLYAGGRVVTFSPIAGRDELVRQLEDSEVAVLIAGNWLPQHAELRQAAATTTKLVMCSLGDFLDEAKAAGLIGHAALGTEGGAGRRFAELVANDGRFAPHWRGDLREEVAVIQYTGGTTGIPKGAMLTHANFSAVMHMRDRLNGSPPPDHDLKILCVLPIWHIFGLTMNMLRAVATKTEVVLHLRFDPGKVLADIAGKRVAVFSGVPAMYAALVGHPMFEQTDISSVKSWGCGGAPLPPEVRSRFETRARMDVQQGYALTETTSFAVQRLSADQPSAAGVGLPVPGTVVEAVDLQTGLELVPSGQPGELCITGPQVTIGYWRRPDENREAFRGGRFHTGDIGFIDEAGYVTVVDRKKDMILVGGHNVFPANIEAALREIDGIADAAVVGIRDEDLGEVPKAFVVMLPGRPPVAHPVICRLLAKRLSSFEIPVTTEVVDALPRSATGKILKKDLRPRAKT